MRVRDTTALFLPRRHRRDGWRCSFFCYSHPLVPVKASYRSSVSPVNPVVSNVVSPLAPISRHDTALRAYNAMSASVECMDTPAMREVAGSMSRIFVIILPLFNDYLPFGWR